MILITDWLLVKTGASSCCRKKEFYLNFKQLDWSGCARLLREKRVQGRPRRRMGAEEAPGPPAESECLEWKSTF